jgi:hypothetical protein
MPFFVILTAYFVISNQLILLIFGYVVPIIVGASDKTCQLSCYFGIFKNHAK